VTATFYIYRLLLLLLLLLLRTDGDFSAILAS